MELSECETLISSDPNTKGFDLSAGTNWIYPLNYQFRDYQYNISRNALFSNTLVCLPTGLGKTLIAAVVMYNFWRWYPRGKIVFLAPTKPLVAQQISACHDIMGIPSIDTIELTGLMSPKNREVAWFTKRVIFATPQVFQNDLERKIVSGELVRCVVIDEAHKALGKHAYCESLRLLRIQNTCFRVLALSATPGSRIEDVCQVIKNLSISNLELRDETSPDIIPYLNKRHMDIILVPLDKDLARFKEKYVCIMDRYVRLLVQYNIVKGDASTLSKGRIFYLYKEFQSKTNRSGNHGQIMKAISRCMSLYHAYELLIRHGLRAFANFCQTHSADTWMTNEPALQTLLDEIQAFLGPFPDIRPLPDGSVEEIPKDLVLGHTKFHKLKYLLSEHFAKFAAKNEETRAIVFVEYRDSVNEVYVSLLQLKPILRPKMFVGQLGQKRKQQMQAMEAFRNNEANVLISTSVGEEGLDVGEVDLIVCFDISQSSPVRLVQRMGRTGRRRDGRIVMLVTDGKEHQALKSTLAKRDSLNTKVLHSSNVVSAMYQESLRLVPPDLDPVCSKMHIVLQPKIPAGKVKRKRKEKDDDLQKENKKKAIVSRNDSALPDEFEKVKSGQSSIMKFLKKPTTKEDSIKASTHMSQSSQSNHPQSTQILPPDSIKLLTSDVAAVEFLTLCAIKASKLDGVQNEHNRLDETYLAKSAYDDMDHFFYYPVPELNILDCIAFLEVRKESPSPDVIEDFEVDQINNDVYVPEHNLPYPDEYRDTNNSPAVGKFDYEDLFEDSCESDKITCLDDQQITTLDNNMRESPEDKQTRKAGSDNELSNVEERPLQNEADNCYAALLEDDYFDRPGVDESLLDQALSTNKQQCEKENNLLNRGCFESILDQSSSDSDIPTSQGELDSKINIRTQRSNSAHYAITEQHNEVGFDKSTNKPSISSGSNAVSKIQNKVYPLMSKTSKSLTIDSNAANSKSIQRARIDVDASKINKSVGLNEWFHRSDSKASCLPKVPRQPLKVNMDKDNSSRFFKPEHNDRSASKIGFHSKTRRQDTVVKSVDAIINQTNNSNEYVNKYFEDSLDEDDDVIFIDELNESPRNNESKKKSVDKLLIEDDDVLFEKEISYTESRKANESNADSSKLTITQILELIDNSTSSKLNLSKISKNSQNLSDLKKSRLVNPTKIAQSKTTMLLNSGTISKDKSDSRNALTSYYFKQENHNVKKFDIQLKTEEPPGNDLDLSDIKWEDDFETDPKHADCNNVSDRIDDQLNLDFEQSLSDRCQTSLLNKKEESFKTNSDGSGIFSENNVQIVKSPSEKIMDFDLGDYGWDSDFETPARPVESLKQFSKSNKTSSPNNFKHVSASGSTDKKSFSKIRQSNKFSSFKTSIKKQLSSMKGEMLKPSTSKDYSEDDSEFESDFFHKLNGKSTVGKDHRPNINFVLTSNRNFKISKESKLSERDKENTEPNIGLTNLSALSVNRKDRDIRNVPFSTGVDKQEGALIERYRPKRKKFHGRNGIKSEFLDCEAEVSSDTSSGTSGEDDDLDGFVSHTQHVPETVDMQGHYLQSIKDVYKTGAFHFKKTRDYVPDNEVFSQPMRELEDSSYLHDSFCVSGGDNDIFTETYEDSFLELIETRLMNKKRKHSKNGRTSPAKKRKLAEKSLDSNSSEDETEKLRKQILDESMILKSKKN